MRGHLDDGWDDYADRHLSLVGWVVAGAVCAATVAAAYGIVAAAVWLIGWAA